MRENPAAAPRGLWILAIAGLAPFPAAALAFTMGPASVSAAALDLLLGWGALVLAFLGGVHWGLESGRRSPRARRMAASLAPPTGGSLIFLARDHLELSVVLGGLIVAFLAQWLMDHRTPDSPGRWPVLSTALTASACVGLAIALEGALRL